MELLGWKNLGQHYPKVGLRGLGGVEEEALKTQGPVVYFLALNMDKG